jgi:hypothetical protein
MRERIAFHTNVPVSVALAYPDGVQVEGRFGDQINSISETLSASMRAPTVPWAAPTRVRSETCASSIEIVHPGRRTRHVPSAGGPNEAG